MSFVAVSRVAFSADMQSAAWGNITEKYGEVFSREGVQFSLETYERLDK